MSRRRNGVTMIGFGVGRSWPLIGREAEQARLLDELRHGGGVLVCGDPGVGKTRLAREVVDVLRDDGAVVQWASATRAAASVPFGALAHVLPDDLSEASNPSAMPG